MGLVSRRSESAPRGRPGRTASVLVRLALPVFLPHQADGRARATIWGRLDTEFIYQPIPRRAGCVAPHVWPGWTSRTHVCMEACTKYTIQRWRKHPLSRLAGTRPRSWHRSSTWRGAAWPGTCISVFQESITAAIRVNVLQIMPQDWIKGFHMDGPVITARGSSSRTRQLAGCWATPGLPRDAASQKVSG
jgi:hypothetical protein